jgi:hypothetical protein
MKSALVATAMSIAQALGADYPHKWLHAMEQIESGGNPTAIGDGGRARGAFQFHKSAWDFATRIRRKAGLPTWPYSKATDQGIARMYAQSYLANLQARLAEDTGRQPRPSEIYLAWNMGYAGFERLGFQPWRAEDARYDAAMRYENLCNR